MKKPLSVNRLAWKLLDKISQNLDLYGVEVEETNSGAIIVDAGVKARGGFLAGKIITEICMGGLGKAQITHGQYGQLDLPSIFVYTDHPVLATLGSQFAGWQIKEGDYFAIGSGPGRALALKPREIYEKIGYKDDFDRTIVVLETEKHPPEAIINRLATDCHVALENLALVLTPTTSVAGATQISGRIVETGIHKLSTLGMNVGTILHAWGFAPIAPVHQKFAKAMARTNDAILYGGTAYYVVDYEDEEELAKIVQKAPSKASKNYGKPFMEIFKEAGYDFYKIDPNLFAPAVLIVNNVRTGNTLKSGEINSKILLESFGFCQSD